MVTKYPKAGFGDQSTSLVSWPSISARVDSLDQYELCFVAHERVRYRIQPGEP